jgi:hypothetical protein
MSTPRNPADFTSEGFPAFATFSRLLCEDDRSSYELPFACRHDGKVWLNATTGEQLTATVVGWREWTGRPVFFASDRSRLDDAQKELQKPIVEIRRS